MILTGIIYTFLETIIELMLKGAIWLSKAILNSTVTVFKQDQNIFQTFVELIPFSETIKLPSLIKGISYGMVMVIIIFSLLKSVASPLTGDSTKNPAQSLIQGALALVAIIAVFGINFGNSSTFTFNGLLGYFGKWFGSILSALGDISAKNFDFTFKSPLNGLQIPQYLAAVIIAVSILVSVFGACVTYIERILSLGLSVIVGPIALAMGASDDTKDTCKQWILSIFTQFLAIFISLIMWDAFLVSLTKAFAFNGEVFDWSNGQVMLNLTISLAILNLMKNSEKILNSFGLRTVSNGDTARSLLAGTGAIAGAAMFGMNAYRTARMSGGLRGGHGGFASPGTVTGESMYGASGNAEKLYDKNWFQGADGKYSGASIKSGLGRTGKYITTWHPTDYRKGLSQQNASIGSMLESANNSGDARISAQTVNSSMGFNETSPIQAIGNNYLDEHGNVTDSGVMQYTSAFGTDNQLVEGVMGDVQYSHGGQTEVLQDAFIPVNKSDVPLEPGTIVGYGHDGTQRAIAPASSGPVIDSQGYQVYKTVEYTPSTNENNGLNVDVQELNNAKAHYTASSTPKKPTNPSQVVERNQRNSFIPNDDN